MAGASASQQMDIDEVHQASEVEQVASSPEQHQEEEKVIAPLSPSISNLKPDISHIEDEKAAKIHIIDTIIYGTLASDASHHTPPSASIQKVYDAFGTIMVDGIDLTTKTSEYSIVGLVDFTKQALVLKSLTPLDLSHQTDPVSLFIVIDDVTYGRCATSGSIILEDIDQSMPYVHHHPHLFQSPLSAINYCIVDHALHRISGKPLQRASHVLVHLKKAPSPLMQASILMGFTRPSHQDQELENMARHLRQVSSFASTSCTFQGPSSDFINEIISQEFFAEYHLLDHSSIRGPNFISVVSAINLLSNQETSSKAERFIRTFLPGYIYLIKGIKRQAPSSGEQTWKTHRAASSMSTSVNKDGSIQINVIRMHLVNLVNSIKYDMVIDSSMTIRASDISLDFTAEAAAIWIAIFIFANIYWATGHGIILPSLCGISDAIIHLSGLVASTACLHYWASVHDIFEAIIKVSIATSARGEGVALQGLRGRGV